MENDRRKKTLIWVTALCVGLWAADSLVVEPLVSAWQARSARIAELDRKVAEASQLMDREPDLQRRWQTMRNKALPGGVSDAEGAVLQAVGRWAGESGLNVSYKPRWVDGEPGSKLFEVQVTGTGDMAAMTRFIYGLESDPLPLRVEELEVTAQDDQGTRLALTARFTGLVLVETAS